MFAVSFGDNVRPSKASDVTPRVCPRIVFVFSMFGIELIRISFGDLIGAAAAVTVCCEELLELLLALETSGTLRNVAGS